MSNKRYAYYMNTRVLSTISDEIYSQKHTKYGQNLMELSDWNRVFLEFGIVKDTFLEIIHLNFINRIWQRQDVKSMLTK